jgi:response regulator NasT
MKPLSILLVEDEVLIRVDIKEMLERAGHVVAAECGNGRRAVELARQVTPELVLLDIMMPGLDGLEVAKCMHELNVPVVIVTAYGQPNFIKRAENVHVYGYVVKPLSEQNLLATVQIAYSRWQEFCQVNKELQEIKEQLDYQKLIAHARAIIQDRLGLSAQEAHKRLLREAMRQQIAVAEIAEKIIRKAKNN